MSNATKFYFKKVRTKRTRLEQDQTNYIHQRKMKLGFIYESSVNQALRKRTYGNVGDHIIRARETNLHDKIFGILATFQQDNTSRGGHLFEIAKAMFSFTRERK